MTITRDQLAANIRLKRIYDPPSPDDGRRILITRYWPRGVPKSAVDEYTTKVAPSRDLVRAFKDGAISWPTFKQRFLAEMKVEPASSEIDRLAAMATEGPITLMCMCEDERRCHRTLVAGLVEKAMAKR